MVTGKPSYLDQRIWQETPFLSRGRTSLDDWLDPFSTHQLDETGKPTVTTSQRMMQIFHHIRRLNSPIRPILSPADIKETSRLILFDADDLLSQHIMSFRMSLQCCFSIRLVTIFTCCDVQRQQADTMFRYWHSRITLQSPVKN